MSEPETCGNCRYQGAEHPRDAIPEAPCCFRSPAVVVDHSWIHPPAESSWPGCQHWFKRVKGKPPEEIIYR
jgi:hypothetical protein